MGHDRTHCAHIPATCGHIACGRILSSSYQLCTHETMLLATYQALLQWTSGAWLGSLGYICGTSSHVAGTRTVRIHTSFRKPALYRFPCSGQDSFPWRSSCSITLDGAATHRASPSVCARMDESVHACRTELRLRSGRAVLRPRSLTKPD